MIADPTERRDLAAERPGLLASLSAKLHAAMATKFVDADPCMYARVHLSCVWHVRGMHRFVDADPSNQECWEHPKDEPDHWMEVSVHPVRVHARVVQHPLMCMACVCVPDHWMDGGGAGPRRRHAAVAQAARQARRQAARALPGAQEEEAPRVRAGDAGRAGARVGPERGGVGIL